MKRALSAGFCVHMKASDMRAGFAGEYVDKSTWYLRYECPYMRFRTLGH